MATRTPVLEPTRGRRVPLVADTPLHDPALDRFGFAEFAHALCLIIDDEYTATPLTIAVSAPWGGGKSSLGCMLQTLLERRVRNRGNDDPRLVCWFNAWEHDDAPHLGAALAAAVARAAERNRAPWRRILAPLPSAMLRPAERARQTLLIAAASTLLAVALSMFGPARDLAETIAGTTDVPLTGAGTLGVIALALVVARRVFTTAREAARFIDDPKSAAARGTMADVKQQFGRLIRHATHDGRLIIVIDDLERCGGDRALEVCQVACQLFAQPGVVTVLLADMGPIACAAGRRYASAQDGAPDEDDEEIGRRYLAKIVQLEIALPPPVPADMRRVIREYGPALRRAQATPRQKLAGRLDRWRPRAVLGRIRAALPDLPARIKAFDPRATAVRRSVEHLVEKARWWPVAVAFGAGMVYAAINPAWTQESSDTTSTADWVFGLLLIVTFWAGVWSRRLRRRARERERETLVAQIEELKERQLSPEEIEHHVLQHAPSPARPGLVSDLVSSSFLDSDEFRAVETFIADHPPALPREAKRTFNHAQLLTEIARARRMFGGAPALQPAHLAKWLLLREQWPGLGRAVALDPQLLRGLEVAAATDALGSELSALHVHAADVDGLSDALQRAPRLSDVIERLVYFQPADPQPEEEP